MKDKKVTKTKPGARTKAPRRANGPQSHEVRIVGGQWKRTKLKVADKPGLRPTPDRVRETLFNWLGQDLTGLRCVDAFAGTGALGFEAASRGAKEVLLVESDGELVVQLTNIQTQLGASAVRVQRGDGVAALRHLSARSQDVIFLDPPFDAKVFEAAVEAAGKAVAAEGYIYLEAPELWDESRLANAGLAVHRYLKAGAVHAHLLRCTSAV
ncbi:16S rRNA (guanine(966)-N(2))-methyltransferase RsmD [Rhodoferax aquaticus]|uniref:16S rRNA (Guanine(966)-N(2))-methyltransferase RsmD n=1 Tax=Rhodoferax aquaticus TaxID=2527691 RepID=A0A515ELP5_9BURK|nr:16S rRNA (guanine(966)-N(2))-methyltransferase RsmD [Rhodoferax aquaticus]QDL53549.1 16S rRNA (guanine(966)-N(2))-methyltransferase RsmD [Rhodoferax aquaticus]